MNRILGNTEVSCSPFYFNLTTIKENLPKSTFRHKDTIIIFTFTSPGHSSNKEEVLDHQDSKDHLRKKHIDEQDIYKI